MKKMMLAAAFGIVLTLIYVSDMDSWAADNATKKDAAKPADPNQAAPVIPTEDEFMKLIKDKCARCHPKATPSLDALKKMKWIQPGKPESSPVYKVIGKNKKPGGTYHNLTDTEKKLVYDFIKNMK